MIPQQKLLYYQYCLDQFMKWYADETGTETPNDISILKSLKLVFFLSAVESRPSRTDSVLDVVFDKFSALPYGHVETDIYSELQQNKGHMQYFEIDQMTCKRVTGHAISDLYAQLQSDPKRLIDEAFVALKKQNSKLILFPAFDLVNLSHQWYSWRYTFSQARKNASLSREIPREKIKEEFKLYRL